MEGKESSNHPISTQFEGCWISEDGNHKIECTLSEDNSWLICTWPNEYVEMYEMDSTNLKGITNSEIIGYPASVNMIIWNTGNHWFKEGNETQKKSSNISKKL